MSGGALDDDGSDGIGGSDSQFIPIHVVVATINPRSTTDALFWHGV